jgi:dTMP kinase
MFITFEGIDGVGKSTQLDLLEKFLIAQGKEVVRTLEPGGTELGQEIRHLLLHRKGDVSPRAEALLYAADRAHHVATKIRPALAAGKVVLSDRYFDSSVAYQGAARELDVEEVKQISLWAVDHLIPDLTVLLDLPADQAIARRSSKGTEPDRLESEQLEFFEELEANISRWPSNPDS